MWRCRTISELMINEQIRDREVRVIGENGDQLGVMPVKEAQKLAELMRTSYSRNTKNSSGMRPRTLAEPSLQPTLMEYSTH